MLLRFLKYFENSNPEVYLQCKHKAFSLLFIDTSQTSPTFILAESRNYSLEKQHSHAPTIVSSMAGSVWERLILVSFWRYIFFKASVW